MSIPPLNPNVRKLAQLHRFPAGRLTKRKEGHAATFTHGKGNLLRKRGPPRLSHFSYSGYLVKVIEGGPEFLHLLLADPFGIPGQDLILHLIDGAGNGGEQLFPSNPDVLDVQVTGRG